MKKKKHLKIYKTPEEEEEFMRKFYQRVAWKERLWSLAELQKYFPDTTDRIIPIAAEFKFSMS